MTRYWPLERTLLQLPGDVAWVSLRPYRTGDPFDRDEAPRIQGRCACAPLLVNFMARLVGTKPLAVPLQRRTTRRDSE